MFAYNLLILLLTVPGKVLWNESIAYDFSGMNSLILKIEFWTQGPSSIHASFYFQLIALQIQQKKQGKENYYTARVMPWDEAV
jgi:Ni,Fe-hydrogenase I cytochrome b subunit